MSTALATSEDYARDVLCRLFPPPLQVGPASGGTGPASFLLLPSTRRLRLVVPAGAPRAAARAVSRQLTGRRARTRAARVITALGVATGAVDRLADRLHVTGPPGADSVLKQLADVLGSDALLLTMPVGPPRATRKPVLQVTDRAGHVLAFVKVGHDALTDALVVAEEQALARVAELRLRRVRPPRTLAGLRWNGLVLLVLEPLPITQGRRLQGPAAREALLDVVRDAAQAGPGSGTPQRPDALLSRLRARLTSCGAPAGTLLRALDETERDLPALQLGGWHGDLNPGNVALRASGPLVWDWERYEEDVPVGFDLLHHDLHREIFERGVPPLAAAQQLLSDAVATLAPLGIGADAARATARLYLVTVGARYLGDQQAEAGAVLGLVDTWIVPALADGAREDRA